MAYHSLFDQLKQVDPGFEQGYPLQKYSGTLADTIDTLESSLFCSGETVENIATKILAPPRIVRAITNYEVENPDEAHRIILLKLATELVEDVYKSEPDAYHNLAHLRKDIRRHLGHEIFDLPLEQKQDPGTWIAGDPAYSKRTAVRMSKKCGEKDLLFIALGHGGLASGLDVYLRYTDKHPDLAADFYTVRFSHHKLKDEAPRIQDLEMEFLRKLGTDRCIVLYDEDKATGETMRLARRYFRDEVFPGQKFYSTTNHQSKIEAIKEGGAEAEKLEFLKLAEMYLKL